MTTPARDNQGKFARTLHGAERDAEACRLRACGYSYEAIAKQLHYGNRSNAHRAVQTALESTVREGADELRELALLELDEMAREAWGVLHREHPGIRRSCGKGADRFRMMPRCSRPSIGY